MYRFTTPMMIFALTLGYQAAHAAPPQDPPSRVVQFADLDLSRTYGAAVLYQRLKGAAETVCAPLDDRDLGRHAAFRGCVRSTLSSAVRSVNQATLTAYYKTKVKGRTAPVQVAQQQVP